MTAVGFRHFAHQSPNHLALAAPDGRHWSRGELCAECDRLGNCQQVSGSSGTVSVSPSLTHCAGLVAMALAFDTEWAATDTMDPPHRVEQARRLLSPYGIQPEQGNVHYSVSPTDCEEAMSWALASLHFGHPVVLAHPWDAESMLRDIERYRVTTSYLAPNQFADLQSLPGDILSSYDVSSLQLLVCSGSARPLPWIG